MHVCVCVCVCSSARALSLKTRFMFSNLYYSAVLYFIASGTYGMGVVDQTEEMIENEHVKKPNTVLRHHYCYAILWY